MSYLFLVALGPVQDFIAAARRTADLKAGSELLVEIAKVVAAKIAEPPHSGTLIFPCKISKDEDKDKSEDPPNKILAQLPEGANPKELATELKCVARKVLTDAWGKVWHKLEPEQKSEIDDSRALAQLERFLEFFAAWEPQQGEGDYERARATVEKTLAGRKALREFDAITDVLAAPGIPKSPLDPAWSSVLKRNNPSDENSPLNTAPLYLKASELLDGVSLLKRVRGHQRTRPSKEEGRDHTKAYGVPSTAEMAIRCLESKWKEETLEIQDQLRELIFLHNLDMDFGDLFFETRISEEAERIKKENEKRKEKNKPLLPDFPREAIKAGTQELLRAAGYSCPPPYYAILVADGDRMGELLSKKDSLPDHQRFSQALDEFSKLAKPIVTKHQGFWVYIGGDDVLALLPVDHAIECASELQEAFCVCLQPVKLGMNSLTEPAGTLSAGIAIVHYREPLQISLERARAAEKAAKDAGRNALAVALHTRGGAPAHYASQWAANGKKLIEAWRFWIEAFEGDRLSRGLPYELRELARLAEGTGLSQSALQAEARRIVLRKEGGKDLLKLWSDALEGVDTAKTLATLSEQMIIARFLAKPEGER